MQAGTGSVRLPRTVEVVTSVGAGLLDLLRAPRAALTVTEGLVSLVNHWSRSRSGHGGVGGGRVTATAAVITSGSEVAVTLLEYAGPGRPAGAAAVPPSVTQVSAALSPATRVAAEWDPAASAALSAWS